MQFMMVSKDYPCVKEQIVLYWILESRIDSGRQIRRTGVVCISHSSNFSCYIKNRFPAGRASLLIRLSVVMPAGPRQEAGAGWTYTDNITNRRRRIWVVLRGQGQIIKDDAKVSSRMQDNQPYTIKPACHY